VRHVISWNELAVVEPTPDEVEHVARALAAAYNDPRNASLLGHTAELHERDVLEHYANLRGHPFLLLQDSQLAGDADLRGIEHGTAEFAFLIAAPSAQGKGLGTRFATMIHAFAFRHLALDRVYASVIPENVASKRVFEKLGYALDETAAYGDEGDLVLRIDKPTFEHRHAAALAAIRIAVR